MALRRVHLRIRGLVQGVSFRASTRHEARRLGVRGWVRNVPNGDVEALAEASHELLEDFIAWCRHGPRESQVASVDVSEVADDSPLSDFQVRP